MEHPLYQPNKGDNMSKEVDDPSQSGEGFFYTPKKVVLTGGPSAGKSTLLRTAIGKVKGIYRASEVATMLLSGGFPAPSEEHPWDEPWQRDLQVGIAGAQVPLEDIAIRRAIKEGKGTVLLDRGLLDGAAFLPGGVGELEEITGLDKDAMLGRYDVVLHLSSSAIHGAYDKASNPHRFEEADEALVREERTLEVWEDHPHRMILDDPDKQTRIEQGLRIISTLSYQENGGQ